MKNTYLDYIEESDFSDSGNSLDEHKKIQNLISQEPDDFDSFEDWCKWYLVFKKMSADDPRHSNSIDSPTAMQISQTYKKYNDSIGEDYVRDVLNRLTDRAFFRKKEIPENLRNAFYIDDSTLYCYEFVTLQERGEKYGRRKRLAEQMRENR